MPQPVQLQLATFQEVTWNKSNGQVTPVNPSKKVTVQFNPQTLKLTYSNQKAGGDQPKGSSTQFVGRGVTKLTMELWFDLPRAQADSVPGSQSASDVRQLTQEIVYFMIPAQPSGSSAKGQPPPPPPGLQITWGTFQFAGIMESLDETLDFFSPAGAALRSSLAIAVSRQEIQYDASAAAILQQPTPPKGITPYTLVPKNKTFQGLAGQATSSGMPGAPGWQGLALANGIENPRLLGAGALIDLSAGASVSANVQLGVTAQTSGALSLNLGGSAGVSGGASLGFVSTASASASVSASASFSFGS
jgi:hypothetical protein